ncbi:hypothetical protein ACFLSQ_04150 [Bacteroidota bacterium]
MENNTGTLSLIIELIGHIIWPLLMIVFILIFKEKISSLFKSIKRLKIADVEAEFEKREKSFAEKEVSPLNDEIDGLVEKINILEKEVADLKHMPVAEESTDNSAIKNRIMDALENGHYRWRSIQKLASLAGASSETVLEILRGDNNVVLGDGKSGRKIARVKNR